MNTIERMTEQELRIIKECLDAAVNGPFFEDWEFHTLHGFHPGGDRRSRGILAVAADS
ncbi:hypothetical protein ACIOJE_40170 [Kitasatospora sp. NPDC087861]|uniref:hypothetical protein n=1 Tax=Kitasatospora sp. NPDC087861 TaxID=3364070 RepID=UPI0038227D37